MNPEYPIFIPTKGRWEKPLTINTFKKIGVPFKIVIEGQEYKQYSEIVDPENIIVLPHQNKGLAVTRNWIWNYAESLKTERFWTFDDNIKKFCRLNNNEKWTCLSGTFLKIIEDFVDRYKNVDIAGMEYDYFVPKKERSKAYSINKRIYSNMLINTFAKDQKGNPLRNECFYNDDTDLCIRVLKNKRCTILFYIFLAKKKPTLKMKGGMTDYYEKTNKRYEFAKELVDKHPDICKIVKRYGRWHHRVNYEPFANNRLILKDGIDIPKGTNNYGMNLKVVDI